jgi:hypothetical protein
MVRASLFPASLVALLVAASGSFAGARGLESLPVTGPPRHFDAVYDLASGVLTIQDPGHAPASGLRGMQNAVVTCFSNAATVGSLALPLAGEEWIDWGVKDCDTTGVVETIRLGYASRALDSAGGGALQFALYSGTQGFGAALGTEIVRVDLAGLPGNDGSFPPGSFVAFTFDITFVPALNVPDGKLGWGYVNTDGDTGPLLIDTSGVFTVGPDTFGHVAAPIAIDFDDISTTGTSLGLTGVDDGLATTPIGFTFDYYGLPVTNVQPTTNGYIDATNVGSSDFTNDCPIPNFLPANGGISPYWDDLSLVAHGEIYVQTKGMAPCREFIVQWDDASTFLNSAASLTFQAKLFESTNAIEFHYGSLVSGPGFVADGSSATVGIEAQAATDALMLSCNTSGSLATGDAFRIVEIPENPVRSIDRFDRYTAPASSGTYVTTDFFVTAPGSGISSERASFFLELDEEDGTCATASQAPFNPAGNPDILSAPLQPVLGQQWAAVIDASGFPNATVSVFVVSRCFADVATAFGQLYLDLAPACIVLLDVQPINGMTMTSVHLVTPPKDLNLCGAVFATQAGIGGMMSPTIQLTNDIDVLLGF